VKIHKKRIALSAAICLAIVALISINVNYKVLDTGSQTMHIRQTNSNMVLENLTQDEWIGLADLIVKGKITSAKNGSGEQVVQFKPDSVYKGTADQEITLHSRNITFEKDKTYIVFVGISDVVTLDSAIYFPVADCVWEVQGDSLDYVPESFSETSKLSALIEKIRKSPGLETNKPKKKVIKNGFDSLNEKYTESVGIFAGKVSAVENGPAADIIEFDSSSINLIKGDSTLFVKDLLVHKKYKVKVGDTVLVFTNGRNFLAARSDCLYKLDEKGYKENMDFLAAQMNK